MASSLHLLIIASITLSAALISDTSDALILPIMKDANTLHYTTYIHQGTSPVPKKLVIDLGASYLWTDHCNNLVRCRSIQCSSANANICRTCSDTCGLPAKNTVTGTVMSGELGEDIITIGSTRRTLDHFLFSCAPTLLLEGLPSEARGMVGLGRGRISLPSQLTHVLGFKGRFTVCLPASAQSKGAIFFDTTPYIKPHGAMKKTESLSKNTLAEVAKSLMYTPLLNKDADSSSTQEDHSGEYYIGVKSININGRRLSIDEYNMAETKLSTIVPYTTLKTSIYKAFARAFAEAATLLFNATRVASVAPFEVCFSSQNIANTRFGPNVPTIDLVLQSNMIKWKIYGANSMVQVNGGVLCLGVLDGGMNARDPIVIGGYQLENNLLEFDSASSRMGFTSLLTRQTECSNFNFHGESSKSDMTF